MAEKREASINALQDKSKNPETKSKLEKYRQQIQNSRLKAQEQIKRYKEVNRDE